MMGRKWCIVQQSAFLEPDLTNLKESIRFTKEDYIEELLLSQVGRDTIKAIEESTVSIRISEEKPFSGERGYEDNGSIILYPKNAKNRKIAGQTLIHEMAHFRFKVGHCQHAEAICYAMELMHSRNREWITESEWENLVELVKGAYSEYDWAVGGYGNFEQFNFVKTDNENETNR